jgi:hypothetical protein
MPWPFQSKDKDQKKSDRRLYIDLLFRKTKMYANYLPASVLFLGDYGDVNKDGEFIRTGNIFEEHEFLVKEVCQGKEEFGSNRHFFASRSRRKDTVSALTADISELQACSLKLGWDIKKDRHAVLVMIEANHHEIKFEGRLHKFIQNRPELADKAFVTKVYRCSAYAQLITDYGQSGRVCVGFKATPATVPTAEPSGSVALGEDVWQTISQAGAWNTGIYHPSALYTPLVTLRQITPKEPTTGYRDRLPPAITDEQEMEDYIPPWGELDEEGDEVDPDSES